MFFTEREVHSSGGILGDAGTLHISVTASLFYFQLVPLTSIAFDTSGVATFSRYYSDGGSGFTEQTAQTVIDNAFYDDGSGTLAALGIAKYGVEWIYLLLDDSHSHLISVYGTASYASQSEASAATAPSNLPPMVASFCTLIGKTIVQTAATELSEVQSSLTTQFSSSLATYHNNTAGIQGGAIDDYYHLTLAEYNALIALLP